jgi:hypothetical protein
MSAEPADRSFGEPSWARVLQTERIRTPTL